MNRLILLVFIISLTLKISIADPIEENDFLLQASGTMGAWNDDGAYFGGGIYGSYSLTDHFAVQFSVTGGPQWIEISPAAIFVPLGMLMIISGNNDDSPKSILQGLFLILSVLENPSFHIPIGDVIDFSPSIHLYRFHYSTDLDFLAKGGLGVTFNVIPNKRFIASLYGEGDISYSKNPSLGGRVGIRLGIKFSN